MTDDLLLKTAQICFQAIIRGANNTMVNSAENAQYSPPVPGGGGQIVVAVDSQSVAAELGIQPGDRLVAINGEPVEDVFAYRLLELEEELLVLMQTRAGEYIEYDIEKDEGESLGLTFDEALMNESLHCSNKCIFCFIDQLPRGMRKSLYYKDDDMRLSFLTGNYITLTNLDDQELDRLLSYHLSPMNVSVHATDPELRKLMLKNPASTKIMTQLRRIVEAGIDLNCQIVLCPGINDGAALDRTLTDLASLGDNLLSVGAVPVGITRFRDQYNLPQLKAFDRISARQVVTQTKAWQQYFLERMGRRIFYAADEFYLRGELDIPPAIEYEDMPQLENGVGMLALFKEEITDVLTTERDAYYPEPRLIVGEVEKGIKRLHILTGTDAAPWINQFLPALEQHFKVAVSVHPVENRFFGDTITVAGLLTGQDLTAAACELSAGLSSEVRQESAILLPDVMLKQDEDIFLDDYTPADLFHSCALPVIVGEATGRGLAGALASIAAGA